MKIKNIKELKKLIENAPDNCPVYFWNGESVFDIDIEYDLKECTEHNGYKHKKNGFMIEVDG
jgi:hypothetical protein